MLDEHRVTVLIPALDEEACIGDVVGALAGELVDEVVVVDNGSSDHTAAVAQAAGATVLYEPRRGYGHALMRGLRVCGRRGIIVFMDADGADDPRDLPALLEPFRSGADLVIGARDRADRAATTLPQRLGNRVILGLVAVLLGHRFDDLGPYRAIRAELLPGLAMERLTYGWTVEMQVKAVSRGLRVMEVPVNHRPRAAGRSKVSGSFKGVFVAGLVMPAAVVRMAVSERLRRRSER